MADKKKYRVYQITNNNPGAGKKKYYIISTIDDEDKLKTHVRGMLTSSTANGGAKDIARAMKSSGDDYRDEFGVKTLAKGMDKHSATLLRNKYKSKTPVNKQYNDPRS